MNPQDPLASLHPLRQPELVGWWPLATGWWLVIILATLSLAGLCYWLVQRYRANAYRRQALHQLDLLHSEYRQAGDSVEYAGKVNALLKRVALMAYPEADIAARHSESWQAFLNEQLQPDMQFQEGFASAPYQASAADLDKTRLHSAARHWIAHHRGAA